MAQVRSTWSGRIDESNRWRSTARRRRPELAPSVTAGVHTAFLELQKGALIEESGSQMTCMGHFLSSVIGFCSRSLFGAGKAVLHPVACDPVPGARGRGQGTETLAELGGLPP
jgi:hypothetical protein